MPEGVWGGKWGKTELSDSKEGMYEYWSDEGWKGKSLWRRMLHRLADFVIVCMLLQVSDALAMSESERKDNMNAATSLGRLPRGPMDGWTLGSDDEEA